MTTKKGKEGKVRLNVDSQTGWTNIAVGDQYNMMNSTQIQQYYYDAFKNYADVNPAGANSLSQQVWGKPMTDSEDFGKQYSSLFFWNPGSDINTNWKKQVYRHGLMTDQQVKISCGGYHTTVDRWRGL